MNFPLGIAWLAVTVIVMFSLAWMKRITGQAMQSESLVAESAMSFLDGCLSSGVLLALILNVTLGWWSDRFMRGIDRRWICSRRRG